MNNIKNVLLVGVGGQGIILTAKILSETLLDAGYDVKMSEVHGMAQRGGSVSSQVRFGEKVHSPIISKGSADFLVAFEKMEGARWIDFLNPEGVFILNIHEIYPAGVLSGKHLYPVEIEKKLSEKTEVLSVDSVSVAEKSGNLRVMNIVLLGLLAKKMNILGLKWEDTIRKHVKKQFVEINIKAFNEGFSLL